MCIEFGMRRAWFDTIVRGWPVATETELERMLAEVDKRDMTPAEQVIHQAIQDRITRLRQQRDDD